MHLDPLQELSHRCMSVDASLRPSFAQILEELGGAREEEPRVNCWKQRESAAGPVSSAPVGPDASVGTLIRLASFEPVEPAIAEDE